MGGDDFTLSTTSLQMYEADYSRTRQPRLKATASIHWLAMFWMTNNTCGMVDTALWKHLALRSFHSSHATSVKRESAPFLLSPFQRSRHDSHQARMDSPPLSVALAPSLARMFHRTCLEKEQEAMMWSIVSGSWSHKK
jgi:hypothetical protein